MGLKEFEKSLKDASFSEGRKENHLLLEQLL